MEIVPASVTTNFPGRGEYGRSMGLGDPRPQTHCDFGRHRCCLASILYWVTPVLTDQSTPAWVGQGMEKGPGH